MQENDVDECQCPYCGFTVRIPREHSVCHDRICCMNCNKAFPIPKELKNGFRYFNINADDDIEGF
jgi:DNA-directed RNA polymerase subunit RPC12/RpoP